MKPEITISRHKKALMLKDGVIKPPKKKVAKRKNTGVSRTTVRFSVKKKSAKKTTKKRRKIQMNKEQKELIRKLNLKSIVECKEEYKNNKAGQLTLRKYSDGTTEEWHYNNAGKLTLWKETNNTYWIDGKPYRKEEKWNPLPTKVGSFKKTKENGKNKKYG